jgi:hypothetical protein
MKTIPLKIIIERTQDGYSAYAEQLNIFSVGSDIHEIKSNILEAVNLFWEEDKSRNKFNIEDLEFISSSPEMV